MRRHRPQDQATGTAENAAVVVGAGPVGLATALALRARGTAVTVVEAGGEGRVRAGSRAVYVHRDSLRLLDAVRPGLGRAIADYGLVWRARRTMFHGRQIYARSDPVSLRDGLPPFTSLRQTDTERLLLDACRAAGVRIEWDTRMERLSLAADGVELYDARGRRWWSPYVVGADGARSTVRQASGIGISGSRTDAFHVVVDVLVDAAAGADNPGCAGRGADQRGRDASLDPLLEERVFHYRHPLLGDRNVLRVPFTGGFQVDVQGRPGDSPAEWGSAEGVGDWLPAIVGGAGVGRIHWVSTYRFQRAVADHFTAGRRILLAGDAAHLFPPFGARGMNSGFADAVEAADAIDRALRAGGESERGAAFERYESVRRTAALHNAAAADRALAHLMPGLAGRLCQVTAAALAPLLPACGRWLEMAPYGPRRPATVTGGRY